MLWLTVSPPDGVSGNNPHCSSSVGVDVAMNTHMRAVKLILKGKPAISLDQMSVRGSNIRQAKGHVAGAPNQLVHVLLPRPPLNMTAST